MNPPRPDSASRNPRIWLWIAAAAILGLLMLLVTAGTWQARQSARLDAALAEIARSGEPVTAADLEAFYVAPPADRDATKLWLDGSAPLAQQAFANAAKDLPFVGRAESAPPPGTPWDKLEAAETLLKQYQPSLALFHQAAAMGGAARYPTKFAQGVAAPLPHLQNLRGAYRLLALEAHARAHRGDAAGAAQSIEAMLALGRSLENEPLAMSLSIRMALDNLARQQLTELLPHMHFVDQDLIRLQERLEQIEYQSGLTRALLGERVISQQAFNDLPTATFLWRGGAQQVHLDYMQRILAAAQRPFPQALQEARQTQAELKATSGPGKMLTKMVLTANAGEALQRLFEFVGRSGARNDAAIAAIAIERYRRQHGALPADLKQLVPDFLKAAAFDPFDGRPLRYVLSEGECLIYNVGADGVDNGGQGDDTGKPDDVLRIKFDSGGQSFEGKGP